jgi:GT2 family glycosyltransferase
VLSTNLLEMFDIVNSSNVGIVGPDVVTPEGLHQNPPFYKPTVLYFINLYLYSPMAWLRTRLYKLLPRVEQKRRSATAQEIEDLRNAATVLEPCPVYMLHGCFLYLTKNYLDKAGLLDEQLFMYGEEDLMSWNCELLGLKRLYLPDVKVLHKDAQSTKGVHKAGRDEFVRTMTIRSKQYLARRIGKSRLLAIVLRNLSK